MATEISQNGWTVLTEAPPPMRIPGTEISIRVRAGDVAVVLGEAGRRYNLEVERLDMYSAEGPDEWGWNNRPVRGQENNPNAKKSNHASGTAADFNATRHPRGVENTYTPKQLSKLREIARDLDGVIAWGEFFKTTVDGMHCEIIGGERAVRIVADRIRAQNKPQPVPAKPTPKPAPVPTPKPPIPSAREVKTMSSFLVQAPGDPKVYVIWWTPTGPAKYHVRNKDEFNAFIKAGYALPAPMPADFIALCHDVAAEPDPVPSAQ